MHSSSQEPSELSPKRSPNSAAPRSKTRPDGGLIAGGRGPPRRAPVPHEPSAAASSSPLFSPMVVCAMDNASTKLRIPYKMIHRTHATSAADAVADSASPSQAPRAALMTVTAGSALTNSNNNNSDGLENSCSVNLQLPQPIRLAQEDGLLSVPLVRRASDATADGNNLSNPMNEGSWASPPPKLSHVMECAGDSNSAFAPAMQVPGGDEGDQLWSGVGEPPAAPLAPQQQLFQLISILKEGLSLPTPPAVCRLFQENRCRQGVRCHQVHITKAALEGLRSEAKLRGNCCWEHDTASGTGREDEDPTWRWKTAMIYDALPRLRFCFVAAGGTRGSTNSSDTTVVVTPSTALSLPSLGPPAGHLSHSNDTARPLELSCTTTKSTGPESSLELSLTSTPFLSHPPGVVGCLISPKRNASGASHSADFPSGDEGHRKTGGLGDHLTSVKLDKHATQLMPPQLSPTLGLCATVLPLLEAHLSLPTNAPWKPLEIPYSSLCRLHLRGPVCKFGDLCRYIHICRRVHSTMATARSPPAGPPNAMPYDAPLQGVTVTTSPGGSGQLFSSAAATNGASSGSRNIGSSSGGVRSDPQQAKARSSSSDDELQLSHVLLPCPTPPPPNVQVKMWQNMPYHIRGKKKPKASQQPKEK